MAKASVRTGGVSRRAFLKTAVVGATGFLAACSSLPEITPMAPALAPGTAVSIVKIRGGDTGAAVEEAIRLLGGIAGIDCHPARGSLRPAQGDHATI